MTLTVDITAPGGAFTPAAIGDLVQFTANFSISSGSASLVSNSGAVFSSAMNGKSFVLTGAGPLDSNNNPTAISGTITFVDTSHLTLSVTATTALVSSSQVFSWGTDDAPAFRAFNTYALANQGSQQVVLNIPQKNYLSASGDTNTNSWFKGIKSLVVNGNNSFLYANSIGYFRLGGLSQNQDNTHSCRLADITRGSTVIQLIDSAVGTAAARISLFSAGDWVLIAGLDLQSTSNPQGFPSNNHFFEYKQIQSVNGGSKQITLTTPTKYFYRAYWPNLNNGSAGQVDPGGPPTIYALNNFDCDHVYNDLKINQVGLQMTMSGRSVVMNRGKIYDPAGMIPSGCLFWQLNSTDLSGCSLEIDKLVGTAEFNNIVGTFTAKSQSSSVDFLNINNCTLGNLNGTPKITNITNTTIVDALTLGAIAYGRTDAVNIFNSSFARILRGGNKINIPSVTFPSLAMSGGIISGTKGDGALPFPPGTNVFWFAGSNGDSAASTKILDQTQDASNIYLQTNQTGGFPSNLGVTTDGVKAHDCPALNVVNCTGCNDALSMSRATPGAPAWSYSFRTYTNSSNYSFASEPNGSIHNIIGRIKQININVSAAHSGALTFSYTTDVLKRSTNAQAIWVPQVNLTIPGLRVITPGGVTGAQSGDSNLALPDTNTWLCALAAASLSGSPTGPFTITVEVFTDQELPMTVGLLSLGR